MNHRTSDGTKCIHIPNIEKNAQSSLFALTLVERVQVNVAMRGVELSGRNITNRAIFKVFSKKNPFPRFASLCHGSSDNRLRFIRGSLASIRKGNCYRGNPLVRVPLNLAIHDRNVSTYLSLPHLPRNIDRIVGGPHRLPSSLQRISEQPNRPSAHTERKEAENSHCPLCPPVPKNDVGVLIRIFIDIGGGALIMFDAGFVSWEGDRWLNWRWLYGGLVGGLLLSAGWVAFWMANVFLSI